VLISNKRILVIDDDQDNRDAIRLSLHMLTDWNVLTAVSGAEGVAIAESKCPNAILMDVLMPGMDGLTTLRQMQINPKLQSIPVIFLTGRVDLIEREFAALLNQQQADKPYIAGIITKPFQPVNLVKQMRSFLNWTD